MLVISQLSRLDPDYYRILGPVFGSRKIAKEVGIHCYDDDNKTFLVAMDRSIGLVGLLSVRGSVISDCYVYSGFRKQGILSSLLGAAIQPDMPYRANCTAMSVNVFRDAGFKVKKQQKTLHLWS